MKETRIVGKRDFIVENVAVTGARGVAECVTTKRNERVYSLAGCGGSIVLCRGVHRATYKVV